MENNEKICPICGEPTYLVGGKNPRKDKLCGKHATALYRKEIFFDENENLYFDSKTKKPIKQNTETTTNTKETTNTTDKITCIGCGKDSNGKHFCIKCYNKFKDRTISIEVKGCTEFTITDAYGNRDTKTANGLYVRSLSEKIIYDELLRRGINCEYERTVTYKSETGEIKELHPDFYLTDYKLYIEHWGYLDSRNKEYEDTKLFKEKIYKAKGYRLAATTSQDIKDIQAAIERLLLENDIEL